jgi:acetyl-CoA carboxylase carboxyltransferase component
MRFPQGRKGCRGSRVAGHHDQPPAARQQLFDKLVAKAYQNGKGINMASFLEIDAVIDPLETRAWLLRGLNATPRPAAREGKKRSIDTW